MKLNPLENSKFKSFIKYEIGTSNKQQIVKVLSIVIHWKYLINNKLKEKYVNPRVY